LLLLLILLALFVGLIVGGLSQLMKALWELRQGVDRNAFIRRGMMACDAQCDETT
jgi:hypothetical protein